MPECASCKITIQLEKTDKDHCSAWRNLKTWEALLLLLLLLLLILWLAAAIYAKKGLIAFITPSAMLLCILLHQADWHNGFLGFLLCLILPLLSFPLLIVWMGLSFAVLTPLL